MDVPNVKEPHEWCSHVCRGPTGNVTGGCAIYHRRPKPCRTFNCAWLVDEKLPHYWYPLKSKIVINTYTGEDGVSYVAFVVDPAYSTRWREQPWFNDIKRLARAGLEGEKRWTTFVLLKGERIPIIGTPSLLRVADRPA